MDAFQEFYHAPVLHANQSPAKYSKAARRGRLRGAALPDRRAAPPGQHVGHPRLGDGRRDAQADGGHLPQRAVRTVGQARPRRDAGRRSTRPKCDPWGLDSFQLFPNFVILIWGQGWYLTYHYWPTSHNTHIFEGNAVLPAAAHAAGAHRARDGGGVVQGVRAAGRQHARGDADDARVAGRRPVPAQRPGGAHAGTCTRRPPPGSTTTSARRRGCDRDDRHAADRVRRPRAVRRRVVPADASPSASRSGCASSMAEMQAFYDAITPRAEEAIVVLRPVPARRHARRRRST